MGINTTSFLQSYVFLLSLNGHLLSDECGSLHTKVTIREKKVKVNMKQSVVNETMNPRCVRSSEFKITYFTVIQIKTNNKHLVIRHKSKGPK